MPSDPPIIYLETTVLLDFIEKPNTDASSILLARVIESGTQGKCKLITSSVTIAEVFYAKQEADGRALDPETQKRVDYLWHPASSPIEPIDAHELLCRDAHA